MDIPAYINLAEFIPSRRAVEQLPGDIARRLQVLPIAYNKVTSMLTVARGGEPSLRSGIPCGAA